MDAVIDSICDKDINAFRNSLKLIEKENTIWDKCPINMILRIYVNPTDKIIGRFMLQELILWGYDKTEACKCLDEIECPEVSVTANLKQCVLTFEKSVKKETNSFTRQVPKERPQVQGPSNYTPFELKRLKAIARDLNINYTTETHLALKIINTLRDRMEK
jgi:hypothetical protein